MESSVRPHHQSSRISSCFQVDVFVSYVYRSSFSSWDIIIIPVVASVASLETRYLWILQEKFPSKWLWHLLITFNLCVWTCFEFLSCCCCPVLLWNDIPLVSLHVLLPVFVLFPAPVYLCFRLSHFVCLSFLQVLCCLCFRFALHRYSPLFLWSLLEFWIFSLLPPPTESVSLFMKFSSNLLDLHSDCSRVLLITNSKELHGI